MENPCPAKNRRLFSRGTPSRPSPGLSAVFQHVPPGAREISLHEIIVAVRVVVRVEHVGSDIDPGARTVPADALRLFGDAFAEQIQLFHNPRVRTTRSRRGNHSKVRLARQSTWRRAMRLPPDADLDQVPGSSPHGNKL